MECWKDDVLIFLDPFQTDFDVNVPQRSFHLLSNGFHSLPKLISPIGPSQSLFFIVVLGLGPFG